jgi:hypothetical protein
MFAKNIKIVKQQLIYRLNYNKNHPPALFTKVTNNYNKNPYVSEYAKVAKQ